MSTSVAVENPWGWLRSPAFDLTLIVGVCMLAITVGAAVVLQPH